MKITYLKEQYLFLKENLSVLILIPTLIGGIWQLLELSSISTSFIRFFSLSQLVADGILVLFILSILYVSFKFSTKLIGKDHFHFDLNKPPFPIWLDVFLILALGFVFCFEIIPAFEKIYKNRTITIPEIALLIPCLMVTIGGLILAILGIVENLLYKNPEKVKSWLVKIRSRKKLMKNISTLISFVIVISFLFLLRFILIDLNPHITNFRQYILFPNNLLNQEVLENKIIKENSLKYKPKMLYNNDKYFFYEILNEKKNKKILVVDYSRLTEK